MKMIYRKFKNYPSLPCSDDCPFFLPIGPDSLDRLPNPIEFIELGCIGYGEKARIEKFEWTEKNRKKYNLPDFNPYAYKSRDKEK